MFDMEVNMGSVSEPTIEAIWQEYERTKDPELKKYLLTHYIPLVKKIVRRLMPRYREYNDMDDLVNCGVLGLIDAVNKFNLSYGVKFETYASSRIRGEVLDYIRKQDWAPSSLRKKIGVIESAYEKIANELQRSPTDKELATAVSMTVAEIRNVQLKSHMFNIVYFEDMLSDSFVSKMSESESSNPASAMENTEMIRILGEIIETLPEKERMVITLHYYEDMTLKEIAKILKVSESRVSQIHSKVLLRMRNDLKKIVQ